MPFIMPHNACRNHSYLYNFDISETTTEGETKEKEGKYPYPSVRFGNNQDVEFVSQNVRALLSSGIVRKRQITTNQVSSLPNDDQLILVHPDHVVYAAKVGKPLRQSHVVMHSECCLFDYAKHYGEPLIVKRCTNAAYLDELPHFLLDNFTFFGLAELCATVTGELRLDILDLVRAGHITQHKRISTSDGPYGQHPTMDYCRMPYEVTWRGNVYGLSLRLIDISGTMGPTSYRNMLVNVGFPVEEKDTMKELKLIDKMHDAYFTHPAEVDAYSIGDLKLYQILQAIAGSIHDPASGLMREVYGQLGLSEWYTPPALSIGKTIAKILESKILQYCDIAPTSEGVTEILPSHLSLDSLSRKNEILYELCHFGSAAYFRKKVDDSAAYLAKVFGGRCRAHRATLARLQGVIVDLDISGCYGQGLRAQTYPLGRPTTISFSTATHFNKYPTLRQFLDDRSYFTDGNELVPGLWTATISLPDGYLLKYPQTYFPSWFGEDPKVDRTKPPDLDGIMNYQEPSLEMATDSGNTKVFHRRIDHSVLTEDGLRWILYACSKPQRNELLDQLHVSAAAYYKASDRLGSMHELRDAYKHHTGWNSCEEATVDNLTTIVRTERECYKWVGVDLGPLLVNSLLGLRQLYPKDSPLNTLYKLIVNGLFGDLVSPHFAIGNCIVGGNITGRGRDTCWYHEASTNCVQSITDGGTADLNEIPHARPGHRMTPLTVHRLRYEHGRNKNQYISLKPLAGYDQYTLTIDETDPENTVKTLHRWKDGVDSPLVRDKTRKEIDAWLNPLIWRHMQECWPDKRILTLHQESTALVVHNKGSQSPPAQISGRPRTGQYELEMKDVFMSGAFQSTANYKLKAGKQEENKARSYNKRVEYVAYDLVDGFLVDIPLYDNTLPPAVFHTALLINPRAVPRGKAYAFAKLIKCDYWRVREKDFFTPNNLDPGDDYKTCGLLKEFSLSQFTVQSAEQWRALEREWERSKKHFGQYVECFFINKDKDCTLNFQLMIRKVQEAIDTGTLSLLKTLDPTQHYTKYSKRMHPAFPTFQALQRRLAKIYGVSVESHDPELYDDDDITE